MLDRKKILKGYLGPYMMKPSKNIKKVCHHVRVIEI